MLIMEFTVKILKKENVTHDVIRFRIEKPSGYRYMPGQACDLSINLDGWRDKKRPFTFTSLNSDHELEFSIKSYKERKSVTNKLRDLKIGDSFIISEPWGAIHYEGNGVFLAGGAGVTPFIAILRQLRRDGKLKGNTLIFSNKTEKDIILRNEFEEMAGEGLEFIKVLTREDKKGFLHGRINKEFLMRNIKDFSQHFYVCGPVAFVGEIQHVLQGLGADSERIVLET